MKKLYILIFLLVSTFLNAQIVTIPDANFKNALIESGVDTNNDGEIQVSEAEAISDLNVNFKDISSMEGIQSFTNLEVLQCSGNQLSNLDMSSSPNLHLLACWGNALINLNVSQNINLTTLVSDNNLLSELDLSQNVNLESFSSSNNQLSSLDLSQNGNIYYIICSDNQLSNLYLDNGNNQNVVAMISTGNANLTCIQVDDENATYPECGGFPVEGWCKDEWSFYSEDCSMGVMDIGNTEFSIYPNPTQNELFVISNKRTEVLGVKIFSLEGKLLITNDLVFKNQASIDVSNLSKGIYFLNLETENGRVETKKFIKN